MDLEEGDRKLLGALGEEGLDDAGAQAVVPHQAPPGVLGQVEVLEHTLQASNPVDKPEWPTQFLCGEKTDSMPLLGARSDAVK